MLELLEPVFDAVVVTRNSSPRARPAAQLGEMAVRVFGEDRVRIEPMLPDALDAAVTMAESDDNGIPGGAGVIVTGSVATVADARRLLLRRPG